MNEDWFQRLITKFTVDDGCWEWIAGKTANGYGVLNIDRKKKYGHRVLYELLVGPIPEGLVIDHLCRNRGCVNPSHMECVTSQENIRRGVFPKGRRGGPYTHCVSGLHPLPEGGRCKPCRDASNRKHTERQKVTRSKA